MIFKQTRVGLNGRRFTLYKIETMKDGWVTRPRIRRWGLDELPQLWNVLKGDMRIFGPRPEIPEIHVDNADLWGTIWTDRLRVKPGLISLACVMLPETRSTNRYDEGTVLMKAAFDTYMIDNMSWRMRLKILRKLPGAILRGQGC